MKPTLLLASTHIDFDAENNNADPKFKVADHVRISKYQNIFGKISLPLGQRKFCYQNNKKNVPWAYIVEDVNIEEITGTFFEQKLKQRVYRRIL